jgi:hypothetical protein
VILALIRFFLRHTQTMTIAHIARELRAEMRLRAEYAARFGIHKPVRAIFLRR